MKPSPKTIIIATGGSAGHVYPALCAALEFKDQGYEVFLIGSLGACRKDKMIQLNLEFYELGAKGLKGNVFEMAGALYSHLRAVGRAMSHFRRWKPDLIIGFGGFGAFPCVVAGWLLGKPVMIHEQNVKPGRANLFASWLANKIAVSFEEGKEEFPSNHKTVWTGYPCLALRQIAPEASDAVKRLNLKENHVTILVFGGSQGSQAINRAFLSAVAFLKVQHPIQVIHICGSNEGEWEQKYSKLNIPFTVFEFYNDMLSLYAAADVVVSRAGAGTVAEIIGCQKPSVLIPYPHAGGHQKYNAEVLQKHEVAEIIEEKDLTPEILKQAIEYMISRREDLSEKFQGLNPFADQTA
ncbi:MAG: undecaprenyldiphospho-muramoylpentapeptide beta-N-acetylglucosaminyltransferase, partial [Sedimentisphaerales bacterium]|nr:undecaprenyldiphospho-muramoylpentapeptide beta-N-acetylglucosaminyltransferase [Sedimentisphaerales bacterium]